MHAMKKNDHSTATVCLLLRDTVELRIDNSILANPKNHITTKVEAVTTELKISSKPLENESVVMKTKTVTRTAERILSRAQPGCRYY
jgi:hypothetical protein